MSDRSTLLLEHHLKELKLPSFLREYGKMRGKRSVWGGRARVRAMLYMGALVGIRYNPVLEACTNGC